MPAKINEKEIIKDLQRVHDIIGHPPTHGEYEKFGKYNSITLRHCFGVNLWNDVLLNANFDIPEIPKNLRYSDDIIYDELNRIENIIGHKPSWTDIINHSKISASTIERRTGTANPIKQSININNIVNDDYDIEKISDSDGYFVSGFVVGEGSFIIQKNGETRFTIGLRADDYELLEFINHTMGLNVQIHRYSNQTRRNAGQLAGDEVRLFTSNRQLARLRVLPFFNKFKLQGRKYLDFKLYSDIVLLMCQRDDDGRFRKRLNETEKSIIETAYNQLKILRHDPTSTLI